MFSFVTKTCNACLYLSLLVIRRAFHQRSAINVEIFLLLSLLSAIMYFENVVMVAITITELIPDKLKNPYLLCFQKIDALCGLLLLFHEIQVNGDISYLIKGRKPKKGFTNFFKSHFCITS